MLSSKQQEYLVYKHTNRINDKVYIGITCQDAERRWQKGYGYRGTYFWNAVNKYGWDTFTHEILLDGLTKDEACEAEKRLIQEYRSNCRECGYNISAGGQAGDNLKPRHGKDNPKSVAVKRIDPNTGQTVVYDSVAQATKELGINHRGISKACRGQARTYKGYVWEYAEIEFEKPKKYAIGKHPHDSFKKKVTLEDIDGRVYHYESIKEAGEKTGIRPNTISRYLAGVRRDSTGRRWSYGLD